jgi:transposase
MRPYPEKHSVIVLDNARIHHNSDWIDMVKCAGGHVEFLPPYSPDFNPIELAFSAIKAYLRRHNELIEMNDDNEYCLLMACAQISASKAMGFFKHCMYL